MPVTALLGLLTVVLALASLMATGMAARPLVLHFVLGRKELAGEAYARSAGAAGLLAATELSVGLWLFGTLFAVLAAACAFAAGRGQWR